jgi:phosphatidate cytidylyltransferase
VLKYRILTAAVLIPIVVSAVFFLHSSWFAAFIFIFIAMGAWEWAAMSGHVGKVERIGFITIFICIGIICFYLKETKLAAYMTALGILWWILAACLILIYQKRSSKISYGKVPRSIMGFLVLLPAWISFYQLHMLNPGGHQLVMFLLVLIWIADSAAYFSGKSWGKTKLCPQVSPGKTWEGAIGALITSVFFAMLYATVTKMQAIEIMIFLVVCALTVIASIFGDLIVSLIKREADIKDSGNLLPGHGGLMDRIDSLTAAGPVFLAGLWFVEAVI